VNPCDEALTFESEKKQRNWVKFSDFSSSVAERDTLHKISLLRWCVGAVGAGSIPSGEAFGARFGV
jgi:hypothetical protein